MKSIRVLITMKPKQKRTIAAVAKKKGLSFSEFVRVSCASYIVLTELDSAAKSGVPSGAEVGK
jgi:hypothetical protein